MFQSTPPTRVATSIGTSLYLVPRVSIHATHAGGDRTSQVMLILRRGFNPRHPRGWRRLCCSVHSGSDAVSIHATHAGGDLPTPTLQSYNRCFNPRHPRGWRREHIIEDHVPVGVSIHATHA